MCGWMQDMRDVTLRERREREKKMKIKTAGDVHREGVVSDI